MIARSLDFLSTVSVQEVDIPSPPSGHVLVRMSAMSVNPADVFSLMGIYPGFTPATMPAVPGLEGMGVVAAVGPRTKIPTDLKGLKIGSRVVPLVMSPEDFPTLGGAWTEYLLVPVENVVLVPDSVEDVSAAQLIVNPLTVIGMLDKLNATKGSYILQAAGGSTLGKQLIQIANSRGLHVISTVRRCDQVAELKAYGSDQDHVICTAEEDVVERVKEITAGAGAYGAVDPVAGDMTMTLQSSVRPGGTVLVYGSLGGVELKGSVIQTLFMDVTIAGYWLVLDLRSKSVAERRDFMRQGMKYLEDGTVVPHSGAIFPIEKVAEAVRESLKEGRSSEGKVLLVTDPKCVQQGVPEEL